MNPTYKFRPTRLATPAAALLAILLNGCSEPKAESSDPLPVEVAVVRPVSASATISAIGTVARRREAELAFRVPGTLLSLHVDAGDHIRRGQVIGRLDATEMEARFASAESDVEQAQRTADRYAKLAETGAVARYVYQDALTRLDQMRAARRQAAFDLRSTTLVSPVRGVVLERIRQAGETLGAGETVISVADIRSPMIVRVPLAPTKAAHLQTGDRASAHFDISPESVAGRVTRIGREASGITGTIEVEVTLAETAGLNSGMLGTVVLEAKRAEVITVPDAVRIPIEALVMSDDRAGAFTIEGEQAHAKLVRLRFLRFDGEDAVVSGLSEGVSVITAGAGYVKNGQPVLISGEMPE
ncbi:efflux RND transporter periplasmic adaptor subunit [Aurantiacibacter flavus]|uniref:Efflux RND transporter periplasmic adaptor subunit n=1 Tax=Aurantiacibacter flavus TaxID=3145232 RepID=A0ABV0CZC6_9SPHN